MSMPKIVILDGYTTNPGDLSWEGLATLGNLQVFERTPPELVVERAKDATIALTNKVVFDEKTLSQLPQLRCISVLATGYNNIDVPAAQKRGVVVCNVRGYAADSVAQHVFALLLELSNKISLHVEDVKNGGWQNSDDWNYTLGQTTELAGKTMGIYGLGQIGNRVADIALAFGMKILAHHKHPERDKRPGVGFVELETLFSESDVVTLHVPLTADNQGIVNKKMLSLMKQSAILINTGRGGLINETDLKEALEHARIAAVALDVLTEEPPKNGHQLIGVKNCLITPHNAWATKEARNKLLEESVENVRAFLAGKARNLVGSGR